MLIGRLLRRGVGPSFGRWVHTRATLRDSHASFPGFERYQFSARHPAPLSFVCGAATIAVVHQATSRSRLYLGVFSGSSYPFSYIRRSALIVVKLQIWWVSTDLHLDTLTVIADNFSPSSTPKSFQPKSLEMNFGSGKKPGEPAPAGPYLKVHLY
jgi:hypothetical protein